MDKWKKKKFGIIPNNDGVGTLRVLKRGSYE